jgi:flagellar biosynthetic protein FliP
MAAAPLPSPLRGGGWPPKEVGRGETPSPEMAGGAQPSGTVAPLSRLLRRHPPPLRGEGFFRARSLFPVAVTALTLVIIGTTAALAQGAAGGVTGLPGLDALLPPGNGAASGRIIQLVALLTVLSLAPGLLVMVTSFTRFAVAFSFLRSGLGLQSTPANLFLVSLALFMTFYVMAPTFDRAWNEGVKPLQENRIGEEEAFSKIVEPFREFMTQHVRPKDLQTFSDLASRNFPKAEQGEKIDLRILIPAFMISELRRGFEIGFLIVLPFLVIDIIVSTIVMSMGMMMLPPTVISLPFKVLFFILIDGWNLLVSGLVRSFF